MTTETRLGSVVKERTTVGSIRERNNRGNFPYSFKTSTLMRYLNLRYVGNQESMDYDTEASSAKKCRRRRRGAGQHDNQSQDGSSHGYQYSNTLVRLLNLVTRRASLCVFSDTSEETRELE